MECAFGITGKDYILLASDTTAGQSIIRMKNDHNKIRPLGPHLAMAYSGESGDTEQLGDYIERNLRLFHIRNHTPLLPPSASSWIRRTLAESIRSRSPYAVNLLLAGWDTTTSLPHLYWLDYLGTKAEVPYAAHGFGMYVSLSTMDKWWREGMDKQQGLEVMKKAISEVGIRLTVKFSFNCILIDAQGIHNIDLASSDPLKEVNDRALAASKEQAENPELERGLERPGEMPVVEVGGA